MNLLRHSLIFLATHTSVELNLINEKVLFVHESIEKNSAQVDTKIVPGKGEPTSVNYRLHRVGGQWTIYDVVVEDVSIIGNYRSQFNRILTRGSFDDLLNRLKEKNL